MACIIADVAMSAIAIVAYFAKYPLIRLAQVQVEVVVPVDLLTLW